MNNNGFNFMGEWHGLKLILFVIGLLCLLFHAAETRAAEGDEAIIFLHYSTGGNVYSEGGVAS